MVRGATALRNNGVYRCSTSVSWVNMFATPLQGVPLNRTRIESMRDFYYPNNEPKFMTKRIVEILVSSPSALKEEPQVREFEQVSPEELTHCTILDVSPTAQTPNNKKTLRP